MPKAGGNLIPGNAIAKLVREQQDLAPVVGFMRKHVGKHGAAGGPGGHIAIPGEFRDLAIGLTGQRIGEHAEALRRAFLVGGGSLLYRAVSGIERSGTLQVRGGVPEPGETGVVKVRKDRGYGASTIAIGSGRLGMPGPRVEVREKKLVHRVIHRVSFQQDVSNLDQGLV